MPKPLTCRLEIARDFCLPLHGHASARDVIFVKFCGSDFRAHRFRNKLEESKALSAY